MKIFLIVALFITFTSYGIDTLSLTPGLKIQKKHAGKQIVSGQALMVFDLIGKDSLPLSDVNVWLKSVDQKIEKHFTTERNGKYATYAETIQFQLIVKHDRTVENLSYILPKLHQDSIYNLTIQFNTLEGEKPLTIPDPKPLEPYIMEPMHGGSDRMTEKPVIYLYSQKDLAFKLSLDLIGTKSITYPIDISESNKKIIWEGKVKNGKEVIVDNNVYPYLFWDGLTPIKEDLNEGFCIEGENIVDFLEDKLKVVGLNQTEITDFITYWAPRLEQNNYNMIRFYQNTEYTSNIASIKCEPKPDSAIRLFMVYKPVDEFKEIKEQELHKSVRKGFTLVEWGGSELSK